jgi:two-component system, OmpR family, copper resistance phosphate regulon response regulator CusR
MRILIIEEDVALAKFLANALLSEQYEVDIRERVGSQGLESASDLVLFDIGDCADTAVSRLQDIGRHTPRIPIIALLRRTFSDVSVDLLDAGADDCLSKPFSYAELSARIRALSRRISTPRDVVLKLGDLKLDRVQRQVQRGENFIELTTKEFSLLEYLMRNAGRRVTRAEILQHVWKVLPSAGSTNVIDVYVAYLRKKIDRDGFEKLIHTSRGVGYEMRCPAKPVEYIPNDESKLPMTGTRQ